MAPPSANGGRVTAASPSVGTTTPQDRNYQNTPQPGAVEELFDNSPADTTSPQTNPVQNRSSAEPDKMMSLINNTNAQNRSNGNSMEFPEMLSRYEHANGSSPLTNEQRNTMLNMMAATASTSGTNNALVSPSPPPPLDWEHLGYTQQEIEELMRLQNAQDSVINGVKTALESQSASINIPGLDGNSFFPGPDVSDPNHNNLDLDQFLNTDNFYTGSSPLAHADYHYDHFGGDGAIDDTHFDVGMDGTDEGRVVETLADSEDATPEEGNPEVGISDTLSNGMRSPTKKRRKN
jgi:heat shock transcription factor